jgi:hypothetical protein
VFVFLAAVAQTVAAAVAFLWKPFTICQVLVPLLLL